MTDELATLRALAEQVGRFLETDQELHATNVFRNPDRHRQLITERGGYKTVMAMHCELWRRKYANDGPRAA